MKYRVKERREELKMSQITLIRKTGICKATISLIENGGDVDIKVSTLVKLGKALKCSVASLIVREGEGDEKDNDKGSGGGT